MEDYRKIYPQVPSAPPMSPDGENFRLQKSSDVLYNIENEMKHENVRKKYKRVRAIFTKMSVGSGVLSIIPSGSGLATSLTGFGAAIGIPLGALGGVCGRVSVGCGMASKVLSHKVSVMISGYPVYLCYHVILSNDVQ